MPNRAEYDLQQRSYSDYHEIYLLPVSGPGLIARQDPPLLSFSVA
jgi:hypothetical protein